MAHRKGLEDLLTHLTITSAHVIQIGTILTWDFSEVIIFHYLGLVLFYMDFFIDHLSLFCRKVVLLRQLLVLYLDRLSRANLDSYLLENVVVN